MDFYIHIQICTSCKKEVITTISSKYGSHGKSTLEKILPLIKIERKNGIDELLIYGRVPLSEKKLLNNKKNDRLSK